MCNLCNAISRALERVSIEAHRLNLVLCSQVRSVAFTAHLFRIYGTFIKDLLNIYLGFIEHLFWIL